MDTADVVDSFMTGIYSVTRTAKSKTVQGRAVAGAQTQLTIKASVQPASGRDILRLPEGRRSSETRVVYSSTQLMVGAQGAAYESDRVAIDGQAWEVQHVESWRPSPSSDAAYYRCIVQAVV